LAFGILAIWELFNKINLLRVVSALLLLFLSGIVLNFYFNISFLRYIDRFQIDAFTLTKLTLCYIFILGFILNILKNNKLEAFFIILCIPIATIVNAPAIFGGVFIFFLLNILLKYLDKEEVVQLLSTTLIICMSILLLYALFQNGNFKSHTSISNTVLDIFKMFNPDNVKTQVNIVVGTIINLLVLYFPLLLPLGIVLSFSKIDANVKAIIILSVCILMSALCMWAVTFKLVNSVQLFNNIAAPLINCIVILLFILASEFLFTSKKSLFYVLIGSFIILCGFNLLRRGSEEFERKAQRIIYSDRYVLTIKELLETSVKNPVGGFIKKIDPKSEAGHAWNNDDFPFIYNLGIYLNILKNNHTTISISDFQPLVSSKRFNEVSSFTTTGVFYQFVEKQKMQHSFKSIERSQVEFIDKYKLDYIIVAQDVDISKYLKPRIKYQIFDSLSKESFIVLKTF